MLLHVSWIKVLVTPYFPVVLSFFVYTKSDFAFDNLDKNRT